MVFEKLKRLVEEHDKGDEAERIYKRERELAYAQAQRRRSYREAAKGKKKSGGSSKVEKLQKFGAALNKNFEKLDTVMLGTSPKGRKRKR